MVQDSTTTQEIAIRREACQSVRRFLAGFAGKRVFTPWIADDNGNELVVIAMRHLFGEAAITSVDSAEQADLIVIGSNGGMLGTATWIPKVFSDHWNGFPETPLCVLPSSYLFENRPFAERLQHRAAPVTLFARDRYSFEHMRDTQALPPCCKLELDDDAAFALTGTPFIHQLAQIPREHILVVERTDIEHHAIAFDSGRVRLRRKVGKLLGSRVKRLIYPLVTKGRTYSKTTFRKQCDTILSEEFPEHVSEKRYVADIGNRNVCDVDKFCRAVAAAHVVFTTRMHVGILAAMIGRPTYLFKGPYHKIPGVYELSLASCEHVKLILPDC
jgi:exopolysaccharide biosynthesis predicted pyruvyltransferase EpsI